MYIKIKPTKYNYSINRKALIGNLVISLNNAISKISRSRKSVYLVHFYKDKCCETPSIIADSVLKLLRIDWCR